jgi:hypothetical protein
VKAMLETVGVAPTRIETMGKVSIHRSFTVLWITLPFLQHPAAYPANTTAVLTSEFVGRARYCRSSGG